MTPTTEEMQLLIEELEEALIMAVHTSNVYWRVAMDMAGIDLYDIDISDPTDEERSEVKSIILNEYTIDIG